jgi:hypothetical protein
MSTTRIHKQTIIIGAVCALFVGGMFYMTYGNSDKPIPPEDQVSIFARYDSSTSTPTADWKKQFFAETGSSTIVVKNSSNDQTTSNEELTATDRLGRDFLTQYAMLHQAGLANNNAVVSSTVANLLNQDYLTENLYKEYSEKDVRLSSVSDDASLRVYGNKVGLLLKAYSPEKDDAVIALEGMQGKNDDASTILKKHAADYQTVLNNLLAMSVPISMAKPHIGLVNGASQMVYIATSLSGAKTDPLQAITSLKTYESAFKLISMSIIYIKSNLAEKNISYTETEGGSYFNITPQ